MPPVKEAEIRLKELEKALEHMKTVAWTHQWVTIAMEHMESLKARKKR